MLNKELFLRDPTIFTIPNDGVTSVEYPRTPQQWDVLRYELQVFVCEGQYRIGLERILRTYLTSLSKSKQPAVWVSGFYGSGKSHLVRMLEQYWRNPVFPDGTDARSLSDLPTDTKDLLRELNTEAARRGGLWAAAGRLSAGADSIRLDMLRIALQSAGLPTEYAPARFALWLRRKQLYEQVKAGVEHQGVSFAEELREMYVSPVLAQSLLDVYPEFAGDQKEARNFLRTQYPPREEITNEELVQTMRMVVELQSSQPGKLPCTLLVFDEMQQTIGEDTNRALEVQSMVEDLCSSFGTQLLVVATGQSAIQATPQLQKLQGRFTVRVELSDRDVEQVVREVVLRKDPTRIEQLRQVLENVSGEIDRHLGGTRIAPISADRADLVPDYPLLPTRRRFWERILRAVDTGTAAQLRTQLRMVHEATQVTANDSVGTVVGGDFIYDQQKPAMLQSGVLGQELGVIVDEQKDGTADGELRSRLCASVFLIGRLPTSGAAATGLRADAATLADLLVEDLPGGSASLRQRVPGLLDDLVEDGTLMLVEGEYRLQTKVSAEWERDYRQRYGKIRGNTARIASDRATALRQAVDQALNGVKLTHGVNKTPRKIALHFSYDRPSTETSTVPVWVRDEWSVSEKAVRDEAQAESTESPLVFVLLPRLQSDALTSALAAAAAATDTLDARPSQQTTVEGMEARKSMETRREIEEARVGEILASVLRDARVYQAGGNEVVGATLSEAVQEAAENALVRLFPEFKVTDVAGWHRVYERAGRGAPDALEAVQHKGDVDKHAAARAILDFVGGGGKTGNEVRKQFMGVGYGWPQDAVDGILLTLLNASFVSARDKSGQPVSAKGLSHTQIGVTTFRREGYVLTALQRIQLRRLATDLGFPTTQGEEAAAIQRVLERMQGLATEASGEPPLPAPPDTSQIEALVGYSGNEQLVRVHEEQDTLRECYRIWTGLRDRKHARLPRWQILQQLLKHVAGLPAADKIRPQVEAIHEQRLLLADVDPVKPLLDELTESLRKALQAARRQVEETRDWELKAIEATDEWKRLPDEVWRAIFDAHQLGPIDTLDISTDERLLESLNGKALNAWAT
nr:BREX system P-loop protein BrxC [Ardenticatenia bacterium]